MAAALINNKYRITRRIGGGSFGEIYMGIGPQNEKVAIKFERQGTRCPQLRHEYKVYRELAKCPGFCTVYHFGTQDNYNVMVMDLLGPSLEDLFNKVNRRFSLKTTLQIADQMLERVDTLHSRHLIHRDIKPANFVIGIGEDHGSIYCVDFGLSKRYRHPKSLQHIPHRDGRSLTGTPRYASINNHLGIEQSRRDDLESIGYVLIYFLKGSLPWQGLKAKNAPKKYRMILEKKQQVSIAQLCQGCPSQFAEFLAYTRSLKFDAKPDINYLRKLFRDLYHSQGFPSVGKLWDWDSMDLDYPVSAPDQAQGDADPIPQMVNFGANNGGIGIGIGGGNIRPSTAAAVHHDNDDLDGFGDDLGYGNSSRPTTANQNSRTQSGNPSSSAAANNSWMMFGSRNGAPQNADSNVASYNVAGGGPMNATDMQQRRPHTAGNRIMSSAPQQQQQQQAGVNNPYFGQQQQQVGGGHIEQRKMSGSQEEDEDNEHVVAGARAMMRYRRTRAPTSDSNPSAGSTGQLPLGTQQQQQSSYIAPGSSKPPVVATQQKLVTSAANGNGGNMSSGWLAGSLDNRPKSAGGTGPSSSHIQQQQQQQHQQQQQSGGGFMSSFATQSSKMFGGSNGPQPQPISTGTGVSTSAAPIQSSHLASLSYGNLKNRFLSGSGAPGSSNAVVQSTSNAATHITNNSNSNLSANNAANSQQQNKQSKLFGMTR